MTVTFPRFRAGDRSFTLALFGLVVCLLGCRICGYKVAGSTPERSAGCSHTCASVTKEYNLVPVRALMACDWEGIRRSGVTLAMRRRLKCIIHLYTGSGPTKVR